MSLPPNCPWCEKPALEAHSVIRYRRGERVLPVETVQWQCPSGCAGPDGEVPYVFADLETMSRNEDTARAAWLEHFSEPMPPAGRPGRPTEEPQTERLQVRMSKADMEVVDRARGDLPRSEFVRRAILRAARSKGSAA